MDLFLKDIGDVSNESRQYVQKRKIVSLLNKSDAPLTIPEVCQKVRLSVPTGTRLINELIDDKIIVECGKRETENGRRPSLYQVDTSYAYSVGVVVVLKGLSLSIFNLGMEEVFSAENEDFVLENTEECLTEVTAFIQQSIEESGIAEKNILGMGMGITGRVNSKAGLSYNYFNFLDGSLTGYLMTRFSFPVYIDNDTHLLGLAEQVFGRAKNEKNAFVVNLSHGLGMAMITNGEIVLGDDGFAGEFGHMQIVDSQRLCFCGKRGCLGTEVSGHALEEIFKEQIEAGETSLLAAKATRKVNFKMILDAAQEGDVLSISLAHNLGFRLGKALGNILNLLNPHVIIIGGKFAQAKEILFDSIKSGMMHSALSLPLRSCELKFSSVGKEAAIKGAGALTLKKMNLI
ncbi:Sugar kinase of the NBD/HSP70 family, may contain an N-terminal HTH domain [Mariniphaga anaerophila]|uniref:Sugar kinase of the NBD/HSP70 family, may contain an N-terminal HTH domain n=1 Tax=Mariniphaga anaerophila TaxID=1484053 RepID=A0A1M5AMC2_9BACT|nr:ROK family protein [Mariniphaga anaerophila]SHF31383.1 Sugar kinase of the NBD/HSP70 family, may contain an N-terminal HTH domain [Mariniphaga anaerophila]